MTKIKFCGLMVPDDVKAANECMPEYAGFVFAKKSRRYVSRETAEDLKKRLDSRITAVGVFVNEAPEIVAEFLNTGILDMAQLHGTEDEAYISRLRRLTNKPLIKAFGVRSEEDIFFARSCTADYVLLDSGSGGTGTSFNWEFLASMDRPYFLAGGLDAGNVREALCLLHPYAVDVSSGIETDGRKDYEKMKKFAESVRNL